MKKKLCFLFILMIMNSFYFGQCFQQISAGGYHSLAIKSDGTLWGWGTNSSGELGTGTMTNSLIPIQIGTDSDWQSVHARGDFSAAIKTNGTLWTWGFNSFGQLGDGTNTLVRDIPTQVGTSTNWQSVSAGADNTFALKTDGTLWAWGYNGEGRLGDGTTISRNTPTQIGTATNWQSISIGGSFSLAIKTDGTLWAWGTNFYGQLGDNGTHSTQSTPKQIGTATNWQSINAGNTHSTGIRTDGTLWAWGNNVNGQIGDGTITERRAPVQVGTDNNWEKVSAGNNFTLAIKTDKTLWAWGSNGFGQLGNGILYTSVLIPAQTGPETDWQSISAGAGHTFTMKTNGQIWLCGHNGNGQIGDGTSINRITLVPIACPTTLAIDETSAVSDNLKVFLNPGHDYLTVSFDQRILSVAIYNMVGQQALTKVINNNKGVIDVSTLISGAYLVKVNIANGTVKTVKIIKR